MIFDPLPIQGAYKITPQLLGDSRGGFARVFCKKSFAKKGLPCDWVQMNTSINTTKGQVRGMHFQRPPFAETKLVACTVGKIYDAVIDLRKNSESYGQVCGVTLDSEKLEMIYIPQGCAHGFQTLTDHAVLHYSHSAPYMPDYEGGVSLLDPILAFDWPLAVVNLSERDSSFPNFSEIDPIVI